MLSKVKIIVLHRYAYSDSSWVVKALSAEQGIISLLIKGGKRKESPFRGILDPLAESEVVLYSSRSELQMVKEAHLCNWFSSIRGNLVAQAEATAMAEVLLRFAPQGMPLIKEFSLFERCLNRLEYDVSSKTFFSSFLLELSEIWGFAFNVRECGLCGNSLTKAPVHFEEESGDVFCEGCCSRRPAGRRAEYLEDLFRLSQNENPTNPNQTEAGILHYLQKHLGLSHKKIQSISWLQETRKLCSQHKTSS